MKYLFISILLLQVACSNNVTKTEESLSQSEIRFIEKSASYFCVGNKNFIPCINSNVVLGTNSCLDYVSSNSHRCAKEHVKGAEISSVNASKTIGVPFMQCAMLEMLENESKSYTDFNQCFNNNYSQSNVHPKLNK